jgi:hypothetical protein
MKISKISYSSAVFLGAFTLVMSLIYGALQWVARDAILQTYQIQVTAMNVLLLTPLIGGFVAYLIMIVAIFMYNVIARKYPISWEVKK